VRFMAMRWLARADPERDVEELDAHRIGVEGGKRRHARKPLDDVHITETCRHGHVAPSMQGRADLGVERALRVEQQPGVESREDPAEAIEVPGLRFGNEIEVLGRADDGVGGDGDPADHDEANLALHQCPQHTGEVEDPQRSAAVTGRIAASWRQSS